MATLPTWKAVVSWQLPVVLLNAADTECGDQFFSGFYVRG
jgi:hypothetical protein